MMKDGCQQISKEEELVTFHLSPYSIISLCVINSMNDNAILHLRLFLFSYSQVDDAETLPDYPYRDDAVLVHKAIHNYVRDIINFYYRKYNLVMFFIIIISC